MDKKIQDVVDVLKEYNQEHIINLLNNTEYQNRNIFELNKEIDNKFSIDYISKKTYRTFKKRN